MSILLLFLEDYLEDKNSVGGFSPMRQRLPTSLFLILNKAYVKILN